MAPQPLDLAQEAALWAAGFERVAGLDEAGRGAWAGPVVAAAVVLPTDAAVAERLQGVTDSKQLSAGQRERFWALIAAEAAGIGVGVVDAREIDAIGILPATRRAMQAALSQLDPPADFLLIDHVRLPQLPVAQHAQPKGDSTILSIAAASIVAKVTRDRLMEALAGRYPGYDFERNKGYGTAAHRRALDSLGPSPVHRFSFQPVRGRQPVLFGAG